MDTLPPDPYQALGVARDATAATIKTAYRKAALKCHPDKVPDKGDEFFKIQQAYELIGDDTKRAQYDDEVRLAELRKNVFSRKGSATHGGPGSPYVEVRTASFDFKSSPTPMGGSFTARGPTRVYEEKRPNGPPRRSSYEDEYADDYFTPRASARKYDGYDAGLRRPQPRPARSSGEKLDHRSERPPLRETEKDRAYRKKQQHQEHVRERTTKYSYGDVDEDSSDTGSDRDGNSGARRRRMAEPDRRPWERSRRGGRLSDDDNDDDENDRKEQNAREYIKRANTMHRESPSPPLDSPRPTYHNDPYEIRKPRPDERPTLVRRTSTKPKEKKPVVPEPPRLSRRDTSEHEIRNSTTRRQPPTLQTHYSSPPTMTDNNLPRRSSTYIPEAKPAGPTPIRRAETMPASANSGSGSTAPPPQRPIPRRTDAAPAVSSNLRHTETHDSGYSTSSPSEPSQPPYSFQQQPQASQPPPSSYQRFKYVYDQPQATPLFAEPLQTPREQPQYSRTSRAPSPPPPPSAQQPTRLERGGSIKVRPSLGRSSSTSHHGSRESTINHDRAVPITTAAPETRERSKAASNSTSRRASGLFRSESTRAPSLHRSSTMGAPMATPSGMPKGVDPANIDLEKGLGPASPGPSAADYFFADAVRSTSPVSMRPDELHRSRRGPSEGLRMAKDGQTLKGGKDSLRGGSFPGLGGKQGSPNMTGVHMSTGFGPEGWNDMQYDLPQMEYPIPLPSMGSNGRRATVDGGISREPSSRLGRDRSSTTQHAPSATHRSAYVESRKPHRRGTPQTAF